MALLPKNRTSVPSHRELHILLISGFIIAALLIVKFVPRAGHEDDAKPVNEKYYVKAQRDESWIEKFAGDPVALFTLILTGATVGLYLATRSLFVATEKLVQGAEDTSRRQLRAYVGMVSCISTSRDSLGFIRSANLTLKNYGATPAKDFKCAIRLFETSAESPDSVLSVNRLNTIIMPSAEIVLPFVIPNSHTIVKPLIKGRITYNDCFGEERWTTIRIIASPGDTFFGSDDIGNDAN